MKLGLGLEHNFKYFTVWQIIDKMRNHVKLCEGFQYLIFCSNNSLYRQLLIIRHSTLRQPRHPEFILENRLNTFHV